MPCVSTPDVNLTQSNTNQDPAVLRVLRAEAAARHAPLHEIPVDETTTVPSHNSRGQQGGGGGGHCYPVNLALAKAALRCLLLLSPPAHTPPLAAGIDVEDAGGDPPESLAMAAADEAVLTKGWDRAFWPGRFEVFGDRPRLLGPEVTVVLDVAHNVDSIARLLAEARRRFGPSELWALFGTGSDKDAVGMLAQLLLPTKQEGEGGTGGGLRRVVLCQAANARAVPVDALAALAARARSGSPAPFSSPSATVVVDAGGAGVAPGLVLERLLRDASAAGQSAPVVLLVCGSFYVVAAARAHLAATRPGLFASRGDWAFHPDPPLSGK